MVIFESLVKQKIILIELSWMKALVDLIYLIVYVCFCMVNPPPSQQKKKPKNPILWIIIVVFTMWSEIVTIKYPTRRIFSLEF